MSRNMAALVLGNAAYPNGGALRNPVNDANDVAAKLKSYGFHVIVCTDATRKEMDTELKAFKQSLKDIEVGLFFFAGHGMQIDGSNYLLAIDTDVDDETDAKHSSLPLDKVIDVMEKSDAATKIIILDACRNNPWERAWNRSPATRGLASVYAPKGTIIGYATSPGQVASDGKGRNGTYTAALLQHIDAPDRPIETVFKRIRNTVSADTNGKQVTWEHTSLSGNFFFNISLGKIIKNYRETSLADSLFVIDEAKPSHKVIKGLKSLNYYRQNDALALLTATTIKKMADDNLFVLGRNIYQAACGGAHVAIHFADAFLTATSGFPADKRKALLDGMLFEIFFDPEAKLRPTIKGNYFNEVFDLQKHKALQPSFEFIAESLVAAGGRFYAIPGKNHELAVTVATRKVKDSYRIDAIYVDGADVLRPEDEESAADDDAEKSYASRTAAQLEEQLAVELVVSSRLLKITYTPPRAASGPFRIQRGYTVRKA